MLPLLTFVMNHDKLIKMMNRMNHHFVEIIVANILIIVTFNMENLLNILRIHKHLCKKNGFYHNLLSKQRMFFLHILAFNQIQKIQI